MLLLTFGVGLGYAILSQQLSINNTVNYRDMKWNVGFKYATGYSGTVTANPSLSNDKKTISVSCDLGTSTKSETCSVDETFENDSTFDIKLSEEPIITFDDNYIESVNIVNADKEVRTLVKD